MSIMKQPLFFLFITFVAQICLVASKFSYVFPFFGSYYPGWLPWLPREGWAPLHTPAAHHPAREDEHNNMTRPL